MTPGQDSVIKEQEIIELLIQCFNDHDVVCLGSTEGCAEVRATDRVGNAEHLALYVLAIMKEAAGTPTP
jgi:hypothetical protein